jgi:hypothetical protein
LSGCKVARETGIVKKKEKKYETDKRPKIKMNSPASEIRCLDSKAWILKKSPGEDLNSLQNKPLQLK